MRYNSSSVFVIDLEDEGDGTIICRLRLAAGRRPLQTNSQQQLRHIVAKSLGLGDGALIPCLADAPKGELFKFILPEHVAKGVVKGRVLNAIGEIAPRLKFQKPSMGKGRKANQPANRQHLMRSHA